MCFVFIAGYQIELLIYKNIQVMKIVVKELKITSDDIQNYKDLDKLKVLKIELDALLVRLSFELDDYKIKYIEKGISGDFDWFKRTKTKKRLYGLMSQLIQTKIGFLGKKEKELNIEKSEKERHHFFNILIKKLKHKFGDEAIIQLINEATSECS